MTGSANNGIEHVRSPHSVEETLKRLEGVLASRGIPILARIDHSAGAAKVGLTLRPTVVLIFGNAKVGTPLMVAAPSLALDLPLKLLVAQDEAGEVWISYNTPEYLQQRHGFPLELLASMSGIRAIAAAGAA
jgi:uncharacterized protein (DUF302 family)